MRVNEESRTVYRNQLVLVWWLGIGMSAVSVLLFSLFAVKATELGFPPYVPLALVALGLGLAAVVPASVRKREIPEYLLVTRNELWAVFGDPASGRRARLDPTQMVRLEGGPPNADVVATFVSPSQTRIRFRLPMTSFETLQKSRSGEDLRRRGS